MKVLIKSTSSPTPFSGWEMRRTKKDRYQIEDPKVEIWDRGSKIRVQGLYRGVWEDFKPDGVDPLFGAIDVHESRDYEKVLVEGVFIPTAQVGGAGRYRLEQEMEGPRGQRIGKTMLFLDDLRGVGEEFFEAIYAPRPLVVEIYPRGSRRFMRGLFRVNDAFSRFEDPIELVVVPWEGKPSYGWHRKRKKLPSQQVQTLNL